MPAGINSNVPHARTLWIRIYLNTNQKRRKAYVVGVKVEVHPSDIGVQNCTRAVDGHKQAPLTAGAACCQDMWHCTDKHAIQTFLLTIEEQSLFDTRTPSNCATIHKALNALYVPPYRSSAHDYDLAALMNISYVPQATCVLHHYVASTRAVPTCDPGACLPSYQGVWQSPDTQALLTGLLHSQEQCLLVSLMLVRLVFAGAHAPQGALPRLAWQSSSGGFLLLSQLVQIHIHPAHAGQLPLTSFVPASQGRS